MATALVSLVCLSAFGIACGGAPATPEAKAPETPAAPEATPPETPATPETPAAEEKKEEAPAEKKEEAK
ncbi:MAG: hypothetical protein IPI67_06640 [Myxococcales bacterium]|nr:hypothetical protein [Myxococcales bacterium]